MTKIIQPQRHPLNINYLQVAEEFIKLPEHGSLEVISVPRREEAKKYQVALRNAMIRKGIDASEFRTSVGENLMLTLIRL